jgi:hypothetical protein
MEGPFEILEQVGYSFRLKLLKTMKVHPVFYVKKLRKDLDNPFPRQANPNPLLLNLEDGEEEFKVQGVLAIKRVRGNLKYQV